MSHGLRAIRAKAGDQTEIMEKWRIWLWLGSLLEGSKTSFTFWARRLAGKSRRRRGWRSIWIGYWWKGRSYFCNYENGDWFTRYATTDSPIRNKICKLNHVFVVCSRTETNRETNEPNCRSHFETHQPHIGLSKGLSGIYLVIKCCKTGILSFTWQQIIQQLIRVWLWPWLWGFGFMVANNRLVRKNSRTENFCIDGLRIRTGYGYYWKLIKAQHIF